MSDEKIRFAFSYNTKRTDGRLPTRNPRCRASFHARSSICSSLEGTAVSGGCFCFCLTLQSATVVQASDNAVNRRELLRVSCVCEPSVERRRAHHHQRHGQGRGAPRASLGLHDDVVGGSANERLPFVLAPSLFLQSLSCSLTAAWRWCAFFFCDRRIFVLEGKNGQENNRREDVKR